MTVIIGILCDDGVVVGADGGATFDAFGQPTICQTCRKLELIDQSIVFGASGHVGLAQRHRSAVSVLWNEKAFSKDKLKDRVKGAMGTPESAMQVLSDAMLSITAREFEASRLATPVIGQGLAQRNALNSTLIAIVIDHRPCLFHFDHQCSPEMVTSALPFVTVGSGQMIADPFLAFLRRIFWPDRAPTLHEGIFAAVWGLDHAILTAPGGIADPIQIAVLERTKENWCARELDEDDLDAQRESIASAESLLRDYKTRLQSTTSPEAHPLPTTE